MRRALLAAALCSAALAAMAAYQVRFIQARVAPYYEAGDTRADRPRVSTASGFDGLLVSNRAEDIAKVRDAIKADADGVSPVTMMVLAVRLYDVGLRDDAVFWFHAARDRMATAAAVLDLDSGEAQRIDVATRNFGLRAGPTINGYAMCDVEGYKKQRRAAIDWVEKNPYAMLFVESMAARPGDRRANLDRSLREMRAEVQEEATGLDRPGEAAKRAAARREARADEKYCWK